jgi:hypothetical protein
MPKTMSMMNIDMVDPLIVEYPTTIHHGGGCGVVFLTGAMA